MIIHLETPKKFYETKFDFFTFKESQMAEVWESFDKRWSQWLQKWLIQMFSI